MLVFRQYLKIILLFLFFPFSCGERAGSSPSLNSNAYNIIFEDDPVSKKWGDYLYRHLSNRSEGKGIINLKNKRENLKTIRLKVDETLNHDYCIEHLDKELQLTAKNEQTTIWLIYQLIKQLSKCDSRFIANDLPPAILNCHSHYENFDFSYREPHFSPNLEDDYPLIIGTNSVETDWGIWGHNLNKILHGNANDSIYAKGSFFSDSEQFCFSSDKTFRLIEKYISDNFGDKKEYTQRFMIMPNDNNIVCECSLCKANGNNTNNATPALSKLIIRLAHRFPYHSFFTSAYLTIEQSPKDQWPNNTGVLISTIDLPKGISLNEQKSVLNFLKKVNQWKNCTSNIYIWDYASNFDDYLTPLPIAYGMKKQFQFFKTNGIKGIFLNASGYDYSSFDDMKTFVAASLMMDTDLSVDSLCVQYFDQFYPKTGKLLSKYYLSLEKRIEEKNKAYNVYGGFKEALNSYLDIPEFIAFYNELPQFISIAEDEEKTKLEKLFVALSFTRLQIAYSLGANQYGFATINSKSLHVKPEIKEIYNRLSQYTKYKNLSNYKEANGNLGLYLKNWNKIFQNNPFKNLLLNEPITALSKLDEDYQEIQELNDGKLGFIGDYHQGWFINGADSLHVQFDASAIKNAKRISIRFLIDERHHISPPQKVEIYRDEVLYKEIIPVKENGNQTAIIKGDVNFVNSKFVTIKMYRNNYKSTIACDEIVLN